MNKEVYIKIRKRLKKHLPKETTTFIFSGLPIRKSADAQYPFHANRNFFYATGIEESEAVLVFDGQKEVLFLKDVDPLQEKWVGHYMRKEEAMEISGIKDVRYFKSFDSYVARVLESSKTIGLDLDQKEYTQEAHGSAISMADYVGLHRVIDVTEIFVRARMVKFDEEVEAIKKAAELTHQALNNMLLEMKPNHNERDMASRFLYEAHKVGGSLMFDTIVASGKNATVLHYIQNNQPLKEHELVLTDLGVCYKGYGADITRTYPISGTFTDRQKEVYNVVLEAFYAVSAAARPGVSLLDLNELAKEKLAQGCIDLGLIETSEDVDKYYYHSVSHSLGLDTHDVWTNRAFLLEAGNVISNEPGLYIEEEGIGIRLETDLLITKDGCVDLAPQILIEIDEIETFLKNMKDS